MFLSVVFRKPGHWKCVRSVATLQAIPKAKPLEEEAIQQAANEWQNARPYNEIPGESQFSLIRSFLPGGKFHKKTMYDFMKLSRDEHGDIFKLPGVFGKTDMVVTFNPNDFETVYRNEGVWPVRRGFESMTHYRKVVRKDFYEGAEGLVTSHGEEWGKFRSTVNPVLMNPSSYRLYLPKVFKVNTEFIERIKDIRDPVTNEVPETFFDEVNRWTFESVVVVAIDTELGLIRSNRDNPDAKFLFENLSTFFRLLFELDIKPSMWKIVRTPKYYEMMTAMDNITEVTRKFVRKAKERLEKEGKNSTNEGARSVFEKLLMIDEKVATVMALDMMFAGVDTTSTIFAGQLLALATNPEKQQKLREEAYKILPRKDSVLTVEQMKNLPYLRACIKEGMRLYSIGTGNFRTAAHDMVLSGYRIPKGTDVVLNMELTMKEEKYFPRANEYIPERWLREDLEKNPLAMTASRFLFLPFGFGPRMCAGKRIVDLEMEICLSRLVRNFHIEFNYPIENAFKCQTINKPNIPLKFKFTDIKD